MKARESSGIFAGMPNPPILTEAGAGDRRRVHVVLVPGFGGFDALGQIEYYPGTTEQAQSWRTGANTQAETPSHWRPNIPPVVDRDRMVLHYFDNLPTAGVRTRADRLKHYLMKRCDRNAFIKGDKLALVGHSTGGLDIRELLNELDELVHREQAPPDAPADWQWQKDNAPLLLEMISRVVFMSVPQRGSNIADWVRQVAPLRRAVVSFLNNLVDLANDAPAEPGLEFLHKLEKTPLRRSRLWSAVIGAGLPGLASAIADVVREIAERQSSDPIRAANARAALSELQLWLDNTRGDFLAIDDLSCLPAKPSLLDRARAKLTPSASAALRSKKKDVTSLARLSAEAREQETERWKSYGIEAMSFATRGTPPLEHPDNCDEIRSYGVLSKLLGMPWHGKTDGPYRLVFSACASGPFHGVRQRIAKSEADFEAGASAFPSGAAEPATSIASWQNDGIVNTASMLWPNGADTLLVSADHGDIIGHYARNRPSLTAPRKYRSYDVFESNSGFDDTLFTQVWFRIFDYCLTALS